jgi:CDP-diacylglycerol--serine O-phosphatidyltransferase
MLFILPNAFTLASVFCGVYAIIHAGESSSPEALYQAAIALMFAGFFDTIDGRIARLTRTQSEFGMELDSLADIVSFGVAPAVVMHKWALWAFGPLGLMVSFMFCACGAIRLARFNVLARKGQGSTGHFVGLPIPLASGMLMALLMAFFHVYTTFAQRHVTALWLTVLLSLLMVSNISYPSFKKGAGSKVQLALAALSFVALVVFAVFVNAGTGFLVVLSSYIAFGIVRAVIRRILRFGWARKE